MRCLAGGQPSPSVSLSSGDPSGDETYETGLRDMRGLRGGLPPDEPFTAGELNEGGERCDVGEWQLIGARPTGLLMTALGSRASSAACDCEETPASCAPPLASRRDAVRTPPPVPGTGTGTGTVIGVGIAISEEPWIVAAVRDGGSCVRVSGAATPTAARADDDEADPAEPRPSRPVDADGCRSSVRADAPTAGLTSPTGGAPLEAEAAVSREEVGPSSREALSEEAAARARADAAEAELEVVLQQ